MTDALIFQLLKGKYIMDLYKKWIDFDTHDNT